MKACFHKSNGNGLFKGELLRFPICIVMIVSGYITKMARISNNEVGTCDPKVKTKQYAAIL